MRIVIALGGNALGKTPLEQLELVKLTAKKIVELVKEGHDIIITHGNGPQVGIINNAFDKLHRSKQGPMMPFAECGAMSQGYIGYHLQQAITNELGRKKIKKRCATVITQVVVDKTDLAFKEPTKPIGNFYSKADSLKIAEETKYKFIEDSGRGYRRVVPSPKPIDIVEIDLIKDLIDNGNIVISCGGGGIPVIKSLNGYKGIDAVIDKDFSSAKIASLVDADVLLILTSIDKVCINFELLDEEELDSLDRKTALKYIKDGQFAKGSMLPKINACLSFVENNKDKKAIITSLLSPASALKGKSGTLIKYN